MADRRYPKEAICAKQQKVTEQILRNLVKGVKIAIFVLGGPNQDPGDPFRVIQWRPALYR